MDQKGECVMIMANRRGICGMIAFAGASLLAGPALAAGEAVQAALGDGRIEDQIAALKPGQFIWAPEVSPQGPVMIIVSLQTQRAYVYRNGVLIGISTASTGKEGHATPTGVFTILQKDVDHKSNLYNAAPMPYMQRLTWDGIAMHAGNLPGYPASHGCIRLPMAFARQLYGATKLGLTVVITDEAAVPRVAPTPAVLTKAAVSGDGLGDDRGQGTYWRPELAPEGPVSILISAADRRLVVLRNGREIGAAPVTIKGDVPGTSAYTLRAVDDTGFHWLQLPLPGQPESMAREVTPEERDRLHMAESFRAPLAAILQPGTTVVVTTDSLRAGGTGSRLTVMTGEEGAGN